MLCFVPVYPLRQCRSRALQYACPLALLRASNERPRHSSAETRNEFPSPHVRPRFREGIVAILKGATEGLKPTPLRCAMSQLGQSRSFDHVHAMSGLPPQADLRASWTLVPK